MLCLCSRISIIGVIVVSIFFMEVCESQSYYCKVRMQILRVGVAHRVEGRALDYFSERQTVPSTSRSPSPLMYLKLSPRNPHEQRLILYRHPAREHLHRIIEIRIEQNLPRPVDQRTAARMQHVQTVLEWPLRRGWH